MSDPERPARTGFVRRIPEGDDRHRLVCGDCGFIHYENPKIVVGAVCYAPDERILLCRRNIEPRLGTWTMPAGYMELGEAAETGAAREAWEEAGADIAIESLLGVYSIPHIGQVHLIYRARLLNPETIEAGPESAELILVPWGDIPWAELSFPSVRWALTHFRDTYHQHAFPPRENPEI
ncbi:ADP-ribose pyrophosphatase YjhB, NUDIX family [Limimonas halophila]|uniref:ADP-ribose pyrophosphatase YjhB, NUDIX family n=1 Tax=Limimonas halophila TaxID=1082479 RepID=A0A1G7PW26_9PROT|nr:NUDIX hydrolase [Limimonas halophila]SDF90466.1 ADP-ribose pyrophosphatase YjhB, NUDIX family [Limimonas halophila]